MATTQLGPGGFPGRAYGTFTKEVQIQPERYLFIAADGQRKRSQLTHALLVDGVEEPAAVAGYVVLFVDSADGQLKVKDSAGNVEALTTTL